LHRKVKRCMEGWEVNNIDGISRSERYCWWGLIDVVFEESRQFDLVCLVYRVAMRRRGDFGEWGGDSCLMDVCLMSNWCVIFSYGFLFLFLWDYGKWREGYWMKMKEFIKIGCKIIYRFWYKICEYCTNPQCFISFSHLYIQFCF